MNFSSISYCEDSHLAVSQRLIWTFHSHHLPTLMLFMFIDSFSDSCNKSKDIYCEMQYFFYALNKNFCLCSFYCKTYVYILIVHVWNYSKSILLIIFICECFFVLIYFKECKLIEIPILTLSCPMSRRLDFTLRLKILDDLIKFLSLKLNIVYLSVINFREFWNIITIIQMQIGRYL